MYSSHHNEHPPIKKNIFIKLMHLSTQSMFLYNNKLFQQIDDVAMECSLAPTMANYFFGDMETTLLKKQTSDQPKMYVRYMDDILAVFDNNNACMSFLEVLNNQHENILYTIKKSENILQFLNVVVRINDKGVDTWIWRKPTNISLFLNFKAVCPLN